MLILLALLLLVPILVGIGLTKAGILLIDSDGIFRQCLGALCLLLGLELVMGLLEFFF